MKNLLRSSRVLFGLLFGLLFASAASASGGTWAILIGGGFAFNSTYTTDYRGIRDFKAALLKRSLPESHILTYFAEGCRNGKVRIAAVLSRPCGFFSPDGHDIEKSNELSNVREGFSLISKSIDAGGTLIIGISTHGEKNGDLLLQHGTRLSLAEFEQILAPLRARHIKTILISTACYSGNLHRLSGTNTCAFASSDLAHMTSAFMWEDSLLSQMAKPLGDGADFLSAFEAARKAEFAKKIALNRHYSNGMDFLAEKIFKSKPATENTEGNKERLELWQRKTGYARFDLRFLDLFAPPRAYFEAIDCAQTNL